MVVDNDCELGSEATGEAAGEEGGEAAGKKPNDDAYDYDEYDFYDQESGEAAGEGPDNAGVTMLRMTIMIVTMILMPCLMAMSRK